MLYYVQDTVKGHGLIEYVQCLPADSTFYLDKGERIQPRVFKV